MEFHLRVPGGYWCLDIRQTSLYISRHAFAFFRRYSSGERRRAVQGGGRVAHNGPLRRLSMTSRKREQLLSTAVDLFYREGYHATGIDRILAESGVAKMTLYKHFRSKDELIMAALEVRRQRTAERMLEAEARLQPRAAILAVFDGLQEFLQDEAFRGCAFIHAAAEFHERSHPIHRQAAEQKAFVEAYFQRQLERLGVRSAALLARQLQYLMEGALVMAHIHGPADQAREARQAAESLLQVAGI
ncbi:transcriptional regulator [Pseudomonas aeruginosa MH38]|nr:transcriptional regulator [Pseudomonas aeruginosa MH38]